MTRGKRAAGVAFCTQVDARPITRSTHLEPVHISPVSISKKCHFCVLASSPSFGFTSIFLGFPSFFSPCNLSSSCPERNAQINGKAYVLSSYSSVQLTHKTLGRRWAVCMTLTVGRWRQKRCKRWYHRWVSDLFVILRGADGHKIWKFWIIFRFDGFSCNSGLVGGVVLRLKQYLFTEL